MILRSQLTTPVDAYQDHYDLLARVFGSHYYVVLILMHILSSEIIESSLLIIEPRLLQQRLLCQKIERERERE